MLVYIYNQNNQKTFSALTQISSSEINKTELKVFSIKYLELENILGIFYLNLITIF